MTHHGAKEAKGRGTMARWRGFQAGVLVLSLLALASCNQPPAEKQAARTPSRYDSRQTFAPLTLPTPVNVYRAGDGTPGPDYWQNRADYKIAADLDPKTATLTGDETITYTNNSPTTLKALWLQLDENSYRKNARSRFATGGTRRFVPQATDGFVLDTVETETGGFAQKADYIVSDTRMQIRLAQPLKSKGGQIRIHIRYHYTVPAGSSGRTGHAPTKNGEIFDLAQWYPRMAVYDDLRGWDTLPYLGSEFYLEYGDIDYAVTVPWDMLVAGSGELTNPDEVLTATERARLAEARKSDKTVMIRTAAEINDPKSRPKQSGTLTWRFHMSDTRDVAFSASRRLHLGRGAHRTCRAARPRWRNRSIRWKGPARKAGAAPPNISSMRWRISRAAGRSIPIRWPPAWAGRSTAWNIPPSPSTATRTRAGVCSGSPRTRSAIPGFRWWWASTSGAINGWMKASTPSSTSMSPRISRNMVPSATANMPRMAAIRWRRSCPCWKTPKRR